MIPRTSVQIHLNSIQFNSNQINSYPNPDHRPKPFKAPSPLPEHRQSRPIPSKGEKKKSKKEAPFFHKNRTNEASPRAKILNAHNPNPKSSSFFSTLVTKMLKEKKRVQHNVPRNSDFRKKVRRRLRKHPRFFLDHSIPEY